MYNELNKDQQTTTHQMKEKDEGTDMLRTACLLSASHLLVDLSFLSVNTLNKRPVYNANELYACNTDLHTALNWWAVIGALHLYCIIIGQVFHKKKKETYNANYINCSAEWKHESSRSQTNNSAAVKSPMWRPRSEKPPEHNDQDHTVALWSLGQ